LIEVGAGFHPELTGRENIFLNGSILGMKKMEIQRCFDSIIHFSELEKFIDTPVKYYSSGMYVRLGFAVAAHTDPGIFLIDEVLAVGDDGFQRKCLDLLTSHKASGKTMILVSHQLNRIEEVCDRCIYLKNGQIAFDGDVPQAISRYKSDLTTGWSEGQGRSADVASGAHILEVSFVNQAGETIPTVNRDDELVVGIRYFASTKIMDPVFGIGIYGPQGEFISGFNTMTKSLSIPAIEGKGAIFCKLRCTSLICGTYNLVVQIHNMSDTITYDRQVYRFAIQGAYSKSRGLVDLQENWAFDSSFKQPLSLMHAGTHLQPANRLGSQC
jgi:energy-coupling factor transporter ATP-binding protein EcfA2